MTVKLTPSQKERVTNCVNQQMKSTRSKEAMINAVSDLLQLYKIGQKDSIILAKNLIEIALANAKDNN